MSQVSIRYFVDDVDEAVQFYSQNLAFAVTAQPGPHFAILTRDNLRLLLNTPIGPGGAASAADDPVVPHPGGWNRFQVEVADLSESIGKLLAAGAKFRNEPTRGIGGSQIVLEDPSGNPVELFETHH